MVIIIPLLTIFLHLSMIREPWGHSFITQVVLSPSLVPKSEPIGPRSDISRRFLSLAVLKQDENGPILPHPRLHLDSRSIFYLAQEFCQGRVNQPLAEPF